MSGQTATGAYFLKETKRGMVAEVAPGSVAVGVTLSVTDEASYPHARLARVTGLGRVFRQRTYIIDEDVSFEGVRASGWEDVQYAYLSFDLTTVATAQPAATPKPQTDPLAEAAGFARDEIAGGKSYYADRWLPEYETSIIDKWARLYRVPSDALAATL
jgi:hypothetical protein